MPPANVSGECVWGFIVRMYIECIFQFIEATEHPNVLDVFVQINTFNEISDFLGYMYMAESVVKDTVNSYLGAF